MPKVDTLALERLLTRADACEQAMWRGAVTTKPFEALWTPREASAYLRLSITTLWRLDKLRQLQPIRIGRLTRYEPETIRQFLELRKKSCS